MENTPPAPDVVPAVLSRRSPLVNVASWSRDLLISIVLAVLVILFLYQPVKVEGTSMMPALVDQERIFINKFVYKLGIGEIQRGDLVVFWPPFDPSRSYIKRVIGLPGDVVEVDNGEVLVNARPLREDYILKEYRDRMSMSPVTVGPEEYFVLGDHRSSSNDSRSWGAVPRNYIYGKAVFVYWPLDKLGVLH
ncbi:MAG: signal peptidase I [Bryobacteraceae bacterium]|nr:signal peptidase I [Bryobacteraceae bacterium]